MRLHALNAAFHLNKPIKKYLCNSLTVNIFPFQMDKRQKIAIGINFSSKERKVDGWKVKELP